MRLAAKNLGHALGGTPHKRGAIYAHIEETISMFAAPPPFACDTALPSSLRAPSASPPSPTHRRVLHASPMALPGRTTRKRGRPERLIE